MSAHIAERQARSRVRETALTIGAVLGLICLVAAFAATVLDVRLLVFRSGSMSPEIRTGGIALARTVPVDRLEVGDVVSVVNSEQMRITHRVVAVNQTLDGRAVVLKGDANSSPDQDVYTGDSADRVFWHVNGAGYVVHTLSSRYAFFAGGMLVAGLLYLGFAGRDPEDRPAEESPALETAGRSG